MKHIYNKSLANRKVITALPVYIPQLDWARQSMLPSIYTWPTDKYNLGLLASIDRIEFIW